MKRFSRMAAVLLLAGLAAGAQAQQFFRIGTGGTAGTYYPVGGMIANAVSQPGKLVVTAQASNGSLANVTGIAGGAIESGFSQADVASWAYTGKGAFEGKPAITGLRMIANLYPESVHIVVRKGSGRLSAAGIGVPSTRSGIRVAPAAIADRISPRTGSSVSSILRRPSSWRAPKKAGVISSSTTGRLPMALSIASRQLPPPLRSCRSRKTCPAPKASPRSSASRLASLVPSALR